MSSRIVKTPTSYLRSMTGSSWMSFDFSSRGRPERLIRARGHEVRGHESDTGRSWTLFASWKNLRGERA